MHIENAYYLCTAGDVNENGRTDVKPGQVWQTASGNLVYIVKHPETKELGFIWYDEVDDDLNYAVANEQRLVIYTHYDLDYWLNNVRDYQPKFIRSREFEKPSRT